jgi:hypothetical protein
MVQSQPRQIVLQDAVLKKTLQKRVGGVAQGVGPDFKPQYCKKKKKKEKREKVGLWWLTPMILATGRLRARGS